MNCTDWNIVGSRGEYIHGTTHKPEGEAVGVVLLGHGFKGYKDYGMLPWLAEQFAQIGWISHRFNFSHSGMLADDGLFVRPDLFEVASWNTHVEDLEILSTTFKKDDLPLLMLGHSRGGLASLLALGRGAIVVAGVISLSAPARCNPLTQEAQQDLFNIGFIESPSSRTSQPLRIGTNFIQEQLDDPDRHDLLSLLQNTKSNVLLLHGEDDLTVPVTDAHAIHMAMPSATLVPIANGNHVFNTLNPFPIDGNPSAQLQEVWHAITTWLEN
jgi:alpha-beta hydrolase superfamily lysophospholipase